MGSIETIIISICVIISFSCSLISLIFALETLKIFKEIKEKVEK